MPIRATPAMRRGGAFVTVVLAVLLAGVPLAPAAAAVTSGGPPPGYARIWLYRDYQPYVSLARPYVRFNGRTVGISEPGGAFYRDVVPGVYRITVDSRGQDANQFARVSVQAGQQIYVEVDALRYSNCLGGGRGGSCPPTFYTLVRPPDAGASAIANSALYGGK
jgi:hypothetical protein